MRRLGGWQRLWVLVGVVYAIGQSVYGWQFLDGDLHERRQRDRDIVFERTTARLQAQIQEEMKQENWPFGSTGPVGVPERDVVTLPETWEQMDSIERQAARASEELRRSIIKLQADEVLDRDLREIDDYYERICHGRRATFQRWALMLWGVPMVVLYLVGWAGGLTVSWVLRGFRE